MQPIHNPHRRDPVVAFDSAVIFGAANGIGQGIAEYLRSRTRLVVAVDRDSSFSDSGVTQVEQGDYRLRADVTSSQQLVGACSGLRKGTIGFACFCVGILDDSKPEQTMQVNVEGTKNCFDAVAPYLKPGALAVFLSSDLITFQNPENPTYVRSKRLVADYANEIARTRPDLRVLTLLPGPVDTMLFRNGKSAEDLAEIAAGPGILSPTEFARMLFEEVLPKASDSPSGAAVKMYKNTGIDWLGKI